VRRRRARLYDEPGVRHAVVQGVLVAALGVAAVAGAGTVPTLVLLVVVAGVGCAPLPRGLAAVSGLVAWAWTTGFAENRFGALTFSSADLARLAAAVGATVLVAVVARRGSPWFARHWSRVRTASPR
jgi:hypothetical protein